MKAHVTKLELNSYTDRKIQVSVHDLRVDIIDDLSFSGWIDLELDLFIDELKRRNLPELPELNGFN